MANTAVDVKELANSYIFIADMPGLKHTDIKVHNFPASSTIPSLAKPNI